MPKKYLLVTGTSASEVERKTGLRSLDTPLGTLVEHRDPVVEAMRVGFMMEQINRALHPPPCDCRGFLHRPDCRIGGGIT